MSSNHPINAVPENEARDARDARGQAVVAAMPCTGFLRQTQVLSFVPISKSTLWRRVQAKTFPAPVKLSQRVTAWRVEDLRLWIEQQGGPA